LSYVDLFTIALKDKDAPLDLPVSSFVLVRLRDANGKIVVRPYSPVRPQTRGCKRTITSYEVADC